MSRWIALLDINSFFASCHQALQPELESKEVIVAGDPQKRNGIVLAASYPAKKLGIKTGMPLWKARQLCPHGHYFKPQYSLYTDFSARVLRIMRDFTDLVEPFSIDEAFMDLTGITALFGAPLDVAARLKARIRSETSLFCSVGIGPNKLIAKMAAEVQKPDGLTVIQSVQDFQTHFWVKPVRELFGVGCHYEKHFQRLGISTIGDLANFPVHILKKRWGKNGELLWYCAHGIDHSPVTPGSLDVSKSVGHQKTLPVDIRGFDKIKVIILELSEAVARRARQGEYVGCTVFLTLRDTQLRFLSRSMRMPEYTDLPNDIYHTACELLQNHWNETWPVRLVGIALSGLIKKELEQYDIFGYREKQVKLVHACDAIRDRFGETVIFRGVSLTGDSLRGCQIREDK